MNGLQGVLQCLTQGIGEIHVAPEIQRQAHRCIDRMLEFTQQRPGALRQGLVPHLGAA
jgi:quinolinate synthase